VPNNRLDFGDQPLDWASKGCVASYGPEVRGEGVHSREGSTTLARTSPFLQVGARFFECRGEMSAAEEKLKREGIRR
jgi:hypothetical protein